MTEQRSSPGSEQEYLEDNIATLAFHLAQPDARLSVSHSGPGLVIEPGEVLKEAARRLGAAQTPMDREQVAKIFAYIWHGDLIEWSGFLSKADAFLAYPIPPSLVSADPFNEILKHVRAPNRPTSERLDRIEAICLASLQKTQTSPETTRNLAESICENCPPAGWDFDNRRCLVCPRRTSPIPSTTREAPTK